MNLSICLFVYSSLVISLNSAYRIFAVFSINGRSHYNVFEPIARGLIERGHQVDIISSFPLEKPFSNQTDPLASPIVDSRASFRYEHLQSRRSSTRSLHEYLKKVCENLGDPYLLEIVRNPPSDPPYDVVLIRIAYGYQCFSAIGHLWNVPVIGIVASPPYPFELQAIGSPLNLAFASRNLQTYKENMNFWDRLYNFVMTHYNFIEYHRYARIQDDIIEKYLGPNLPHYTKLEREVSLILTNSHPSLHGFQPKAPAQIEIGGIHIKTQNSTIDLELKKILDESENGFIYFSFGTFVVLESLPQEILERFLATFRNISPVRVVIKSKNLSALPHNIPRNVFTFSWLPQQEVLQHPNIKGFLSHAGGLGSQEAIYYGVPVICVPFFVDQLVNCDISCEKGFGIKLDIQTAQQADYDNAFNEILRNPKYKTSVERLSLLYRDRPIHPKNEAVYWIEYVARHGKKALRSTAVDLEWWQIELLDVWASIFVLLMSVASLVLLVIRKIVKFLSPLQFYSRKEHSNVKMD